VRITVQPVGVVAEQRRERIKLDQAVAHETLNRQSTIFWPSKV